MKLRLLFMILTVIISINSYDYKINHGSLNVGTLDGGKTYSFYLEAKTGQHVIFSIYSSSKSPFNPFVSDIVTVYYYIDGQSSYSQKKQYSVILYHDIPTVVSVILDIEKSERNYVKYIIFEYTPLYQMENTIVSVVLNGQATEDYYKNLSIEIQILILIFAIIFVVIIIYFVLKKYNCFNRIPAARPNQQPQEYDPPVLVHAP